jgi:hypothetical protein
VSCPESACVLGLGPGCYGRLNPAACARAAAGDAAYIALARRLTAAPPCRHRQLVGCRRGSKLVCALDREPISEDDCRGCPDAQP